ncbi:DUF427 domain-containing protein [Glycomyces harbinensis]|uniref:Uncharacterized conserved protein, DUF427 family n=1 Tax=Glycomyces harbinensis TaxID=58114 RepID=A0A1G6R0L2_9ACTN|nr:DUF427 domain-containing protein [Glycomyces harbinensis]SDC97983.1 Uncharacterized conserved protein, DUF427 family [Glycomyces harbinensis]
MSREIRIPGPDHPIEVRRNPNRLRVTAKDGGEVIADTTAALTLSEADYPPVDYLPLADVDQNLLARTDSHTYCPYKGEASYYSLVTAGKEIADAVWVYERPHAAVPEIAGHVAFYPQYVETTVAESEQDRGD